MRPWLIPTLCTLCACGPSLSPEAPPELDGGAAGDPCGPGEQRCAGNLLEVCVHGRFEPDQACPLRCLDELGCVACDPAAGDACDGDTVVRCNPDGSLGEPLETCAAGEACASGECTRPCGAAGTDLIYVVDTAKRLLSFDPTRLDPGEEPFTLIGTLACPASSQPVPGYSGPIAPFSMSVDRQGRAWVLYTSGEIFHVAIDDAACAASGFEPLQDDGGWALFGMGFASDSPGGDAERVHLSGGDAAATPGGRFGYVDPATLAIQTVGNLPAVGQLTPELTGTGDAELFGFFPGTGEAWVQEIDRGSGALVGDRMEIPGGLGGLGVQAWAFAHWGGDFYIFVTVDGNSTVRRIDRATSAYQVVREQLPYVIVGAGVSTCAPIVVE